MENTQKQGHTPGVDLVVRLTPQQQRFAIHGPELLEALKVSLKRLEELEFHFGAKVGHSSGDTIGKARIAIDKATSSPLVK